MRRLLATALLAATVPAVLVLGVGAGEGGSGYRVRAIFDNASATVPGEDVKVAGVVVGAIESLDVTPENRAAIVLAIERPGFAPFRSDARCTIRPQSLIGEKFVECHPGSASAPPLGKVPEGRPGAGQDLLPVERTSSPVDIDLINNILRRPYRERLAILLSELGAGLAGRGRELNEVIHRANPALRETDRVLDTLAGQNRVLRRLVEDSDTAIAPLARERERVSDFVVQANATAEAAAERREDISRSIERLPPFLRELRPTLTDLGELAGEMTPVLDDLGAAAPDLNRLIRKLGPFSRAAVPALRSLGEATDVGRPALEAARPLVTDLRRFASDARPVSLDLDELTESLDETGGIERAMDWIFHQATAVNGFDGISHYLRAALIVNLCSSYAVEPVPGCSASFSETRAIRSEAATGGRLDPRLASTRGALRRPRRGLRGAPLPDGGAPGGGPTLLGRLLGLEDPRAKAIRERALRRIRRGAEGPPAPAPGGSGDPQQPLLDYLFGGER